MRTVLVVMAAGIAGLGAYAAAPVEGSGGTGAERPVATLAASPERVVATRGVHRVVRLENDRVLVVENRYDPGAESALHTHASPRVVYVLDGGAVQLVAEDGSTTAVRLDPGMTIWRPAETHVVRNTGRTTVRLLETEVRAPH